MIQRLFLMALAGLFAWLANKAFAGWISGAVDDALADAFSSSYVD